MRRVHKFGIAAVHEGIAARTLAALVASAIVVALVACGDHGERSVAGTMDVVRKATCGPGSHPETALQGQVPPPLRRPG
jgi:hypothetical protein